MKLYLSRNEQYAVVVLLLAIIGALFVLSYAYGKRAQESDSQPFFVQSSGTPGSAGATSDMAATAPDVVVHVAGAVKQPGLYHVPAGGRINDALQLAGGARADGYADALNLAEKLQDGERVYVPTRAEWQQIAVAQGPPALVTRDPSTPMPATAATPARSRATAHERAATSSGTPAATKGIPVAQAGAPKATSSHRAAKELPKAPIHLNSATYEQLHQLPGVGDSTAQKILDYRKAHGKFTDPTQLIGVGGIGQKKFAKMAQYLKL